MTLRSNNDILNMIFNQLSLSLNTIEYRSVENFDVVSWYNGDDKLICKEYRPASETLETYSGLYTSSGCFQCWVRDKDVVDLTPAYCTIEYKVKQYGDSGFGG